MSDIDAKLWVTVRQAAEQAKLSDRRIRQLIEDGTLYSWAVNARLHLIRRRDLDKYIDETAVR